MLSVEAPALSFTFPWERAEYARLIKAVARNGGRRRLRWFVVAVPVVMLALALAGRDPGDWLNSSFWMPWALIALLWTCIGLAVRPGQRARAYEKKHPCVLHPFRVRLDDDGVETSCAHSDVRVRWFGIKRVVETPEFFLFYVNDACAHYLPKRAADGEHELAEVRAIVARHTAELGRGAPPPEG